MENEIETPLPIASSAPKGDICDPGTSLRSNFQEKLSELRTTKCYGLKTRFEGWLPLVNRGRPFLEEINSGNIRAGITVALVSTPLSISLAIAGGGTPAQGIITSFWSGVVSSMLGGSQYNICGPTGGLSATLLQYSIHFRHGTHLTNPQSLNMLAIVSGLISIVVGWFRLHRFITLIPHCVLHGFTVAVACIIALNQLNYFLGIEPTKKHEKFIENVIESFEHANEFHPVAVAVFIILFTCQFLAAKLMPRAPWPVGIAIIGIIYGKLCDVDALPSFMHIMTIHKKYGDLNLSLVSPPSLELSDPVYTFKSAVFVTFLSILETLVSATIADRMVKEVVKPFSQFREVVSVGVANVISGLMGGLPGGGGIARTSVNIKSGATSRVSLVVGFVTLFVLAQLAFSLFQYLPLAVVGSILCNTAYRMLEPSQYIEIFRTDKWDFMVFVATALVCVFFDTSAGILLGIAVAHFHFLDNLSRARPFVQVKKNAVCESYQVLESREFDHAHKRSGNLVDHYVRAVKAWYRTPLSPPAINIHTLVKPEMGDNVNINEVLAEVDENGVIVYRIVGVISYLDAAQHVQRMRRLRKAFPIRNIILDLKFLFFIDLDAALALRTIVEMLKLFNLNIMLSVPLGHFSARDYLMRLPTFRELKQEGKVFVNYKEAVKGIQPTPDYVHVINADSISINGGDDLSETHKSANGENLGPGCPDV